jgi:subtilisin family serine protease/subtilisin-like proprotein convertase family protein/methionine-rich copper-binding protein CopC
MFAAWKRRRDSRQTPPPTQRPLTVEALEERTLLNAGTSSTVLDLNGLNVNPNQYSSTDILVRFQSTPGSPGGPAIVAGTKLDNPLPLVSGLYQVDLSPGMTVTKALAAYQAEAGVLDAEPDYQLTVSSVPNDPLLSNQWNLNNTGQSGGTPGADIHAQQAWGVTTGSPKVVVAVLDTGIDYNNPDLYQNIWINQAEIPSYWYVKDGSGKYDIKVNKSEIKTATPGVITFRDLNNPANAKFIDDNNGDGRIDAGDLLRPISQGGWEVTGNTQDGDTAHPDDLFGWNFVSNTNSPLDDNGHGTHVSGILGATGNNGTGVAGVDWNVQIMPLKFIGADGSGTVSDFIQALNYAVQHGAKITNNSWEGAPSSQALYNAINNARTHGQIFVAAAGNEGNNDDQKPDYPASFSQSLNNVVAVAATDNTDHLASFSDYGVASVALAAPGVNILSTLPGGQYGTMSGTSMATPEVTGALALVWGQHPSWTYTQVINQVLSTVDKVPGLQGKVASGGRLDLAAALGANPSPAASQPTTPVVTSVASQGPTTDSMNNLSLTFNAPIDPRSFTTSAVQLTDPSGKVLPVKVTAVSNSGNRQITLSFPNQTLAGQYKLSINSNVKDLQGLRLTPYVATITLGGPQKFTNSTPAVIEPQNTTISTIRVPQGTTIGQLQVQLNINFPSINKLTLRLTAPNGESIVLSNPSSTAAIASGGGSISGSSLNKLAGADASGTWKLTIQDAGTQSGKLLSWSLLFSPPSATSNSTKTASTGSSAKTAAITNGDTPKPAQGLSQTAGNGSVRPVNGADEVFASPLAMSQVQTGLLVVKQEETAKASGRG